MKKTTRKIFSVFLQAVIAALCLVLVVWLPGWAAAEAAATIPEASNLLAIIEQYAVIPVTAVCLGVGWVLKNAFEKFNNKYIPLALFPVAVVGVLWMRGWAFTPDTFFAGFCSAALAVYIHSGGKHAWEALKQEKTEPPEQAE